MLIDFSNVMIYLHLLGLTAIVFLVGYLVERSKVGTALQVIGEDETVADQCGINRSGIKIFAFVISAVLMTLVGAVMAPRLVLYRAEHCLQRHGLVPGRHHGAARRHASSVGTRCSALFR